MNEIDAKYKPVLERAIGSLVEREALYATYSDLPRTPLSEEVIASMLHELFIEFHFDAAEFYAQRKAMVTEVMARYPKSTHSAECVESPAARQVRVAKAVDELRARRDGLLEHVALAWRVDPQELERAATPRVATDCVEVKS